MKVSDFTLALVLFALAFAMAAGALSFPPMPGQAFGPKLFPSVVAAGFALCAVALIMHALVKVLFLWGWLHKNEKVDK